MNIVLTNEQFSEIKEALIKEIAIKVSERAIKEVTKKIKDDFTLYGHTKSLISAVKDAAIQKTLCQITNKIDIDNEVEKVKNSLNKRIHTEVNKVLQTGVNISFNAKMNLND